MTLAADTSPAIGRPTFLGIWRELADAGSGVGPVILAAVTAVAGLASGIIVSGMVGFAAAAALWGVDPKASRQYPQEEFIRAAFASCVMVCARGLPASAGLPAWAC
jgi:hypothetical protein